MFCASMIGGTLFGTGQLYDSESAEHRVIAMRVRTSSGSLLRREIF